MIHAAITLLLAAMFALLPDDASDLARRVRDLRREGQACAALSLLAQQPATLLADPRVAGERIQCLLDDGRIDEARAADRAAGQPKEGALPLTIARLRLAVLNGDAEAVLRTTETLRAQVKDPVDVLGVRLAALCALQRWGEAEDQLAALPVDQPPAVGTRWKTDVLLARGRDFAQDPDQLERAIPLLEQALGLAPERTDVRVELVLALADWQRTERAEQLACETLHTLDGKPLEELFFALGKVRQAAQRDAEAVPCFLEVLARQPRHRGATLALARSLLRDMHEEEGLVLVQQRLQQDPDDADALFFVADYALDRREAERAADALGRILETHPKSRKALYMFAQALALHGESGQQAEVLRRYDERGEGNARP